MENEAVDHEAWPGAWHPLCGSFAGMGWSFEWVSSFHNDFNRDYLTQALARHDGNVSAAAREIGIERQYLHKIIKALGLAGHAPEEGSQEPGARSQEEEGR